jgi:hypothetical protein
MSTENENALTEDYWRSSVRPRCTAPRQVNEDRRQFSMKEDLNFEELRA